MERRIARGYRKPFLRDLELWEAVTDLQRKEGHQARAGAQSCKEAGQSLSVGDLVAEDGLKKVIKVLEEAFAPYQETALPRAMESAFFAAARRTRKASRSTSSGFSRRSLCLRLKEWIFPARRLATSSTGRPTWTGSRRLS